MNSQPPAPLPVHPDDGNAINRVEAHFAEYSMLTTRATYNIAYCTAVWSLVAGYLALMVNMASRLKQSSLLQWASVPAIELMLAWISTFILDQYGDLRIAFTMPLSSSQIFLRDFT